MTTYEPLEKLRRELSEAGKTMIEQGLTFGNAGNLSARFAADRIVVSATGTRLGELSDEDLVEVPLHGDISGMPRKPSKEMPMHRAVYNARPDVMVVLHGAPLYTTMFACSDMPVPSDLFIESMYYLERVARVPYHHPGSEALGLAVGSVAKSANVLLLENHGVLVYDKSVSEAMSALQTLETVCQMVILSRSAGITLKHLPQRVVQDFLTNAGYKPRRQWAK
jgi:3-dehydro-4-phosphotetronate decarboxylase